MARTELSMRAAVLHQAGADLVIEELSVEEPRPDEVLVEVRASGVCHSDLSVARGEFVTPLPAVLGHEGAGVVKVAGSDISHVREGDHVLILFRAACGSCAMCRLGRPALCAQGARLRQTGTMVDGTTRYRLGDKPVHHFSGASTFAELAIVPGTAVVPVAEAYPLEHIALVGCAVMTGVGAALNSARVQPGDVAVVIGCGGVGLSAVQGCAIGGAAAVVAIDLAEHRLERARELGATHAICVGEQDPLGEIKRITDDLGADIAIETAGRTQTLRLALELIRAGGTAVAVGVPAVGEAIQVEVPPFVVTEKVLKGCFYGTSDFHRDVPRLLRLYESGALKLDAMVGREVELADVNEALAALESDALGRTVIRM